MEQSVPAGGKQHPVLSEDPDKSASVNICNAKSDCSDSHGEKGDLGHGTISVQPNTSACTSQIPPAAPDSTPKIRHEWYQNDDFVMVSIFVKKVPKEAVEVGFFERALSVSFPLPSGSSFSLEIEPLAHEIVPSSSGYEVMSTKVELKLKKKMSGLKWGALEDDALAAGGVNPSGDVPAYPSSAKNRKDWGKLEKEVDEDKPEGDAALNALFQSIYRDASEDTRRAMMKSFVESNGTCLSTNWEEVGKKRVECSPPDGMEARKFGF